MYCIEMNVGVQIWRFKQSMFQTTSCRKRFIQFDSSGWFELAVKYRNSLNGVDGSAP